MCIFFKTLINCYADRQDFAILRNMFEKAQRTHPFGMTKTSPRTNLKFELQLRLIYLPVSCMCSVSKRKRCRRLNALCTKKKDKTTQMPRSMNRIPNMRGFRTKACLPITMILFQKIRPIQSNTVDRSCCCRDSNSEFDFNQDCLNYTSRKSLFP